MTAPPAPAEVHESTLATASSARVRVQLTANDNDVIVLVEDLRRRALEDNTECVGGTAGAKNEKT